MTSSRLVLAVALLAALLLLAAGPGTRFGAWDYGTGFLLMRVAFYAGLVAASLAALMLIIPGMRAKGAAAFVLAGAIGLATAWVPWNGLRTVRSLPFIHDITTDTVNPPDFVAVKPLREDAPNPVEYPGEEVATQQRQGYPDLDTVELDLSVGGAYDQALATAQDMGWEIVAAVPEEGRIEATATTFWFGFKDDVVIRIEPNGSGGSRVDLRSKSRVGKSDVGANAARIRRFIEALNE